MTNVEVINAFLNRENGRGGSIFSTGDRLISRGTILAQYQEDTLWVNITLYCSTYRNKHLTLLKEVLYNKRIKYQTIDNIPNNCKHLGTVSHTAVIEESKRLMGLYHKTIREVWQELDFLSPPVKEAILQYMDQTYKYLNTAGLDKLIQ